MNISHRAPYIRVPALVVPRLFAFAGLAGRFSAIVLRAAIGSSAVAPRAYRREGFPDCELAQIAAGKKDRFPDL